MPNRMMPNQIYFFGSGFGRVLDREYRRCNDIAVKYGAWMSRFMEPSGDHRYWFACPKCGASMDRQTAKVVMEEVGVVRIA